MRTNLGGVGNRNGGVEGGGGIEQYSRHGNGSLSGFRMCISKSVTSKAKTENSRSDNTYAIVLEFSMGQTIALSYERSLTMVVGCMGKYGSRVIAARERKI